MESKALAEKFDQTRSMKSVEEIDAKYEQLLNMWVHPDFAHRLSEMFHDIRATVNEIEEAGKEIQTANQDILYAQNDIEATTRARISSPLDEWRNMQAANEDELSKWDLAA